MPRVGVALREHTCLSAHAPTSPYRVRPTIGERSTHYPRPLPENEVVSREGTSEGKHVCSATFEANGRRLGLAG
jgi:hypothetical protein